MDPDDKSPPADTDTDTDIDLPAGIDPEKPLPGVVVGAIAPLKVLGPPMPRGRIPRGAPPVPADQAAAAPARRQEVRPIPRADGKRPGFARSSPGQVEPLPLVDVNSPDSPLSTGRQLPLNRLPTAAVGSAESPLTATTGQTLHKTSSKPRAPRRRVSKRNHKREGFRKRRGD
jgi:hypothetical protein